LLIFDFALIISYEDEIARLKHELETRGGPSFVPGTSAAALIQFPTPPNLEQELQAFSSGFANLPALQGGGEHGIGQKRPGEDDNFYARNVRPREEITRRSSIPQHPVVPFVPGSGGGGGATTRPIAAVPGESRKEAPSGTSSGFDWLVVYNPKAERSITIDLLHTMTHENVVCCVRFSADGRFLATGSNRIASVFSVKTGERVGTFVDVEGVAHDGDQYVRSVAFSPDGRFLVTGSEDQIVRVWDIAEQKLRCRLSGHSQDIYSVDWMPSGKEVVSGSGDRTIRIWDVEGARCRTILTFPDASNGTGSAPANQQKDAGITSVAVSPNGKYIAAGSLDRAIRLWEVETGKALETLEGHRDSVYSVAFAPDGRHLISGSLDKTIKVWQLDSADALHRGTCKYTILGHKDFVLSVAGTPPDGRWIVSGSKDRSVQFWDSLTGTTQLMLQGHKNSVISVAISPTGCCFATGSGDCRARIWSYSSVAVPTSGAVPAVISPGAPSSNTNTTSTSTSTSVSTSTSTSAITPPSGSTSSSASTSSTEKHE
jgi:glucose repression regulatory protein TUP1